MSSLAIVLWILGGLITLTLVFELLIPRTKGDLVQAIVREKPPEETWALTTVMFLIFLVFGGLVHLWDEWEQYYRQSK